MKENGWMIYNMDLELKHGLIKQSLKDIISMVRKKDLESITGEMDQYILEIGLKIN